MELEQLKISFILEQKHERVDRALKKKNYEKELELENTKTYYKISIIGN